MSYAFGIQTKGSQNHDPQDHTRGPDRLATLIAPVLAGGSFCLSSPENATVCAAKLNDKMTAGDMNGEAASSSSHATHLNADGPLETGNADHVHTVVEVNGEYKIASPDTHVVNFSTVESSPALPGQ